MNPWEKEKSEPHALLYVMYQSEDRTIWPEVEGVYANYDAAVAAQKAKMHGGKGYVIKHLKAKQPDIKLKVVAE